MQVNVQNALVSDALREHVRRRMDVASDGFYEQVEQITVDLYYAQDVQGAYDKVCRLCIELRPVGFFEVTSTNMHFASAVDSAARKLRLRLAEELRPCNAELHDVTRSGAQA